jgi:hypothetical protein
VAGFPLDLRHHGVQFTHEPGMMPRAPVGRDEPPVVSDAETSTTDAGTFGTRAT